MEETWTGSFREGEVKMEKKTMGSFLAALRKANGMTQKELAERLNVSDKAVSRWERDECAPDLSLIPVLGEIFGVTADELICGERKKTEAESGGIHNVKLEKELDRILRAGKTRFQNYSMIAIGLGFIGLIMAMFCNFCLNRAYIGFFAACIFYVIAGVCMVILARVAYAETEGEAFETERVKEYRWFLLCRTGRCRTILALLFAFCLPLFLLPWDAYWGIFMADWLRAGVQCSVVAFIICLPVSWAVKVAWGKKEADSLSKKERLLMKRTRLKLKCYLISAGLVCLITVFFCLEYSQVQVGNGPMQGQFFWNVPTLKYQPTESVGFFGCIFAVIAITFFVYWKKRRK